MLMLVAAGTLAVLDASGRLTPSSLLALTFALGIGAALNGPAWQAIQPELVPRAEFPQAVTMGGASINLGRALGPALGGFLLAVAEAWLLFALNALSFGVVVVVLWVWRREPDDAEGPPERFAGAVRAGVRYALFSRSLTGVLARAGLFSVASAGLMALLPVYARDVLGLGSGGLGLLLAAFGGGALIAAAILPAVRARLSEDGVVTIGTLGIAAALLALAVVRSTPLSMVDHGGRRCRLAALPVDLQRGLSGGPARLGAGPRACHVPHRLHGRHRRGQRRLGIPGRLGGDPRDVRVRRSRRGADPAARACAGVSVRSATWTLRPRRCTRRRCGLRSRTPADRCS